jgi:hypothetical protein
VSCIRILRNQLTKEARRCILEDAEIEMKIEGSAITRHGTWGIVGLEHVGIPVHHSHIARKMAQY